MVNIVNLQNYKKETRHLDRDYSSKLCRIRDNIEEELYQKSLKENDQLAVSLAAGRYAAMNLGQLIGYEDAITFFQECLNTANKYKN
tara:strand:- start:724 stop:984 length:261 start_codon:yes stop_codon:yes gene_type:complete